MKSKNNFLLAKYEEAENNFSILNSFAKYENLVRANGNHNPPVQRWFHLKEAFSVDLLETLLHDWNIPPTSLKKILDPFCGIGTTLLAGEKIAKKYSLKNLELIGVERNPFIYFVARTKLNWHKYNINKLKKILTKLSKDKTTLALDIPTPGLSTLKKREVYGHKTLKKLLAYRDKIKSFTLPERDLLMLGFANILEAVSGVRKDGRALRIVPGKKRSRIKSALSSSWDAILDDLISAPDYYKALENDIYLGDGRKILPDKSTVKIRNVDLILFSPPYLNNIDYTEVYKLELWLCGFINNTEEFRSLRYKTFRSHPSVRFPDKITFVEDIRMKKVKHLLDVLIESLPKDKNLAWRTYLIQSYFDDIYIALKAQLKVLSSGGWSFCVVGNSLHGSAKSGKIPIASDLIIALIARSLGFKIEGIQIARTLSRRSINNRYSRESIVVMKKPL